MNQPPDISSFYPSSFMLSSMFTGLVDALGTVVALRTEEPGRRLSVTEPMIACDLELGPAWPSTASA